MGAPSTRGTSRRSRGASGTRPRARSMSFLTFAQDVVELGCGTAYVGAWLKRRGARRVVGVDITPAQLESARRVNIKTGLGLELVEANAEATGLPGASFDLAISEYGASIWCDPYKWIPEAARLLRSNGELVFLRNSTLSILCMPDTGKSPRSCSAHSSVCTASTGLVTNPRPTSTSGTRSHAPTPEVGLRDPRHGRDLRAGRRGRPPVLR